MLISYWTAVLTAIGILLLAVPYVMRVRHPEQKPLAAYFIFVTVFIMVAFVLYNLLVWLSNRLGVAASLEHTLPALLFLALVFLPAFALATWQARKPPMPQQGPPD
jgi:hypothetical protein